MEFLIGQFWRYANTASYVCTRVHPVLHTWSPAPPTVLSQAQLPALVLLSASVFSRNVLEATSESGAALKFRLV